MSEKTFWAAVWHAADIRKIIMTALIILAIVYVIDVKFGLFPFLTVIGFLILCCPVICKHLELNEKELLIFKMLEVLGDDTTVLRQFLENETRCLNFYQYEENSIIKQVKEFTPNDIEIQYLNEVSVVKITPFFAECLRKYFKENK